MGARTLGTTAKVVMPNTADPYRVERRRRLGAEVELTGDVHAAFSRAQEIEQLEGRTFVHPFEGPRTALGTATLGYELMQQDPGLEAVVVPVGGGGLAAGVSAAVKLLKPECLVIGVEPEGNDTMLRSLRSGQPEKAAEGGYRTIADSLSPPYTMEYSLGLCRRYLDDLVLVSDDALRRARAAVSRRQAGGRARGRGGNGGAARASPRQTCRKASRPHRLRHQHRSERYREHLAGGTRSCW